VLKNKNLKQNEAQSARAESAHKGVNWRSKYVTQVQQQRPESIAYGNSVSTGMRVNAKYISSTMCVDAEIQSSQIKTIEFNHPSQGNSANLVNSFTASASKISGLKAARTRLQTVYFPVLQHVSFNAMRFDENFHMPVRNRRQNILRVSSFAFLLTVLKRHHSSEGVNVKKTKKKKKRRKEKRATSKVFKSIMKNRHTGLKNSHNTNGASIGTPHTGQA